MFAGSIPNHAKIVFSLNWKKRKERKKKERKKERRKGKKERNPLSKPATEQRTDIVHKNKKQKKLF